MDDVKTKLSGMLTELSGLYARLDESRAKGLVSAVMDAQSLFVAGAGRSGFLLRCFTMRMMHMGKPAHFIGDATTPSAAAGDLLLIGSGSGETGSLTMLAKKAGTLGIKTALITTNPLSTIAGMADVTVVIPAPHPKTVGKLDTAPSVQPMGNLFEQGMFLLLDAVVMTLMERTGMTSEAMFRRHANLE